MRIGTNSAIWAAMMGVGAAIGVAPGTAQALSCADPNYLELPRDGAVDVPTNALLWGFLPEYARLLGPSGEVIDVDERILRLGSPDARNWISVLVPRSALQPSTEYTIDDERGPRSSFRTGSGPSLAIPSPPTLITSETRAGQSWSGWPTRVQTVEFEGVAEPLALIGDIPSVGVGDGLDDRAAIVSLQELLVDEDSLDEGPRPGLLPDWVSRSGSVTMGIGDCVSWPSGAADRQDARFAVFDLTGNLSAWVDVPIELPSREEAQAVVDAERALQDAERDAAAQRNLQGPRSCSVSRPGAGSERAPAWLALGIGLAIARRRALRRASPSER